VQIAVTDSGEGIDPAFLPHVFEPFRQAESPQTRVHGGLGLGLSIVRYLAEAHGGTITAESEGRGRGATFTVTLPVRAVSTNSDAHGSAGYAFRHRDRLRGLQILVLDDDDESRKMITTVLRAAGASVVSMDTGSAALEAIDQNRPDLVLTDIAMPEMDGYAFTRALRAREFGRDVKVVALSAFSMEREEQSDFDACLSKPIDPFRLIDEIARIAAPAAAAGT
jgi:CheY-like chemotaxis protein